MPFTRVDQGGLTFFTVPGLPDGVRAIFSTRLGGVSPEPYTSLNVGAHVGDSPANVTENRRRLSAAAGLPTQWATVNQVHGCAVHRVDDCQSGSGPFASADAMITDRPGLALAIFTADCTAVYLIDPVRRAVGLAHAGWRGTAAGIAGKTMAAMREAYGSDPSDCYAAIAPSIGPCCYEVDSPVIEAMRHFSWLDQVIAVTRPGHWQLDLWRANSLQLIDAGLHPDRILSSQLCTACNTDLFYSHRAEAGHTGRLVAVILTD